MLRLLPILGLAAVAIGAPAGPIHAPAPAPYHPAPAPYKPAPAPYKPAHSPAPYHEPKYDEVPQPYAYQYGVADEYSGTNFNAQVTITLLYRLYCTL